MDLYFAPLEGLTDFIFRGLHHRYFGGLERYYIPFLTPTQTHRMTAKERREVLPENNMGMLAVPQLLTKSAADFIWAARELQQLGYEQVNLNLGCPSGTVVPKGKGAGFLADPARLDCFLAEIFRDSVLPISIKTRVGMSRAEEFAPLLEIFNQYPVRELIVHPRTKTDLYQGPLHWQAFRLAAEQSRCPVCFNGDVTTPAQFQNIGDQFHRVSAVMIGRGLLVNPALALQCRGLTAPKGQMQVFHQALCQGYLERFQSEKNTLMRMKNFWVYWVGQDPRRQDIWKRLRKTTSWPAFYALAQQTMADPAYGFDTLGT